MINRLVYEVRLRKTKAGPASRRWRWDVNCLITTDPEYPGVETGRRAISGSWGYTRFRRQAVKNIRTVLLDNQFKKVYEEV